jgi:ATP/maltotriose-dependent transcriptional regulator MalT
MPRFVPGGVEDPLPGLTLDDTQRLLATRNISLADDLIATLHRRVEGNVQLLTLAVDILGKARNPASRMARLAEAPDIERFLLIEVDRNLHDGERILMQAVSVLLGQPGTRMAIAAVLGTRQGIRQTLNVLIGRYLLIRSDGDAGEEYRQHDIVRAFYYSLLQEEQEADLVEMHRRAAEYYETSEDEHDLLRAATHVECAGDHAHAASLVVGDRIWPIIRRGQAHPLQIMLGRLTVRTLHTPLNVDVPLAHGDTASFLRQVEKAEASYCKALELLEQLPDEEDVRERKLRLCYGMGTLLEWDRPHDALDWVVQGLAQITEHDTLQHARLLLRKGSVLIGLGACADAQPPLQEALLCFPETASDGRISALINLAAASYGQGLVEATMHYLLQAAHLCEQTDNELDMGAIQHNIGIFMQTRGDWAAATEAHQKEAELAERLGDRQSQTAAVLSMGILATNRGDAEAASSYLLRSVELARQFNLTEILVKALASLSDLHIRLEAWDAAAASLSEAEALLQELNTPTEQAEIARGWAQVALARGETEQALAFVEQAVQHGSAETSEEEGKSRRVLGMVLAARHEHAQAYEALQRSLALLDADYPYEAARTRAAWAQILLVAGGDEQHATTLLQAARATFARLGAQRDLALVEQLL